MKIFEILDGEMCLVFWSWCCVPSPTSKSRVVEEGRRRAREDWFLVLEGTAEPVPRGRMVMAGGMVQYMVSLYVLLKKLLRLL